MKYVLSPLFMLSLLPGCGADSAPSLSSDTTVSALTEFESQVIHKIQPLGVDSACFGSHAQTVRDHRYTPPRVYQKYMLGMKDCAPAASSLQVQMLGGQQWSGGWSFVTIKKNGLCLTSLVQAGGVDRGESEWKACVEQYSSSPDRFRQQWELRFNHINALQIKSHAARRLGLSGGQEQCLDRQNPAVVSRGACSLHNWQIVRGN